MIRSVFPYPGMQFKMPKMRFRGFESTSWALFPIITYFTPKGNHFDRFDNLPRLCYYCLSQHSPLTEDKADACGGRCVFEKRYGNPAGPGRPAGKHRGIGIPADYPKYPNRLAFNKVPDALRAYKAE